MTPQRFLSVVIAWIAIAIVTCQATPSKTDNTLEDNIAMMADNIAKLSEQLTRQSQQLNELSNKQNTQSAKLTEVSKHQTEQANQFVKLHDQQANLIDRLELLETEKLLDEHTKNDFINPKMDLENRMSMVQSTAGPTFIRWGRRSCNETNSDIIYLGVAAGEHSSTQGGGGNLLCLSRHPTFANYDSTNHGGLELFVAEYNIDPADNYPFEHNDPILFDNDVPCAMCEVSNGSSVMMIPGRADCYSDWRMEYRGYLVTGGGHMGYICVDAKPEADYSGGGPATYALRLRAVEANCVAPSLPCPPYGDHWEISCVVCSK